MRARITHVTWLLMTHFSCHVTWRSRYISALPVDASSTSNIDANWNVWRATGLDNSGWIMKQLSEIRIMNRGPGRLYGMLFRTLDVFFAIIHWSISLTEDQLFSCASMRNVFFLCVPYPLCFINLIMQKRRIRWTVPLLNICCELFLRVVVGKFISYIL